MSTTSIRPLGIGVVRHAGRILVQHGLDATTREHFYRPPGGAIEFGERAVETVRREFREELGFDLEDPRLLCVLENRFRYEGEPGHEIVFVFEARLTDPRGYEQDAFSLREGDTPGRASWRTLPELQNGERPLYPRGLLEVLLDRGE